MLWLVFLLFNTDNVNTDSAEEFKKAEAVWRAERAASFKAPDSWLNLVGLFWLQEGPNPFGASYDLRIVLPKHSTVSKAGVFYLENGKARYEFARAQRALLNGEAMTKGALEVGDEVAHNHLRFYLIERGGKLAIRARDLRAKNFKAFEGLSFYPAEPKYSVEAEFVPYDPPKSITITTVVSTELQMTVPGVFRFELMGKQLELIPTLPNPEDEKYFIMFQDQTSGTTTYSGGRFMYVSKPVDGKATLNFNRAYNPPCAYTNYATCPLPPSENWLDAPIEVGERIYAKHDEYQ